MEHTEQELGSFARRNLKNQILEPTITQNGGEYYNIFAVWDWARIPGVTNPHYAFDKIPKAPSDMTTPGTQTMVGGASDSLYSVNTYRLNDSHAGINTQAHKSWFFFDNEVVCLGSGITSSNALEVNTTIDQNLLNGNITVSTDAGESTVDKGEYSYNNNLKWVMHNNVGYVFPKGGNLVVKNALQEGNWNKINTTQADKPEQKDVFSVWFDHGVKPKDDKYAYIVVPNKKSSAEMNAYNANDIEILANSDSVQVVRHKSLNIWQMVFTKASIFEHEDITIKTDAGAAIILKGMGTPAVTMHIADPAQTRSVITVATLIPSMTLDVKQTVADFSSTGNHAGKTRVYVIDKNSETYVPKPKPQPEPGAEIEYASVATHDSYVLNGAANETKNYGKENRMIIKNDGVGYNREGYVKFSLADLDKITDWDQYEYKVVASFYLTTSNTEIKSVTWDIRPVDDLTWDETKITWKNRPLPGTSVISSVAGFSKSTSTSYNPEDMVEFDLTEYVLEQYKLGKKEVSININNGGKGPSNKHDSQFATRENAITQAHPQLIIRGYRKDTPTLEKSSVSIADTYVNDGPANQNKNFGGGNNMTVKRADLGSAYRRESYVTFSLNDLKNLAEIQNLDNYDLSIDASFYVVYANTGANTAKWEIRPVDDTGWDEMAMTWSNKPAPGSQIIASIDGFLKDVSTTGYIPANVANFNITDYVMQQYKAGKKKVSLHIFVNDKGNNQHDFQFGTKENTTAEFRPKLVIKTYGKVVKSPATISSITVKDREYDGSYSAQFEDIKLDGITEGDDVQVDTSDITIRFIDSKAENDKKVIVFGLLGLKGKDVAKYDFTLPDLSTLTASITPAPLAIKARNLSMEYGSDLSTLNLDNAYEIEGFKNLETEAVLEGKISVSIDTSITSTSTVGTHSGTVLIGGVSSHNYNITYTNGDLEILKNTGSGYITFDEISPKKYGDPIFNLSGRHSLDKVISFESSDPSIISISNESGTYKAIIHKAGTVTLTARFDGDSEVNAESVNRELSVSKADLTVRANNFTRKYGESNPDISDAYTYEGFVKVTDQTDFISHPTAFINSIYTETTDVASYSDGILVEGGEHPCYNLIYEKGTLTISKTVAPIETTIPSEAKYGDPSFNLVANHQGNEKVLFRSDNPSIISIVKEGNTWKAIIHAAGEVNITAYTEGTSNSEATEVVKTITVTKASLVVKPNNVFKNYGDANPVFSLSFSGLQYEDSQADLGSNISITTTATAESPTGEYPIVASGIENNNYDISYNEGVLSIYKLLPVITLVDNQEMIYNGSNLQIAPATISGIAGSAQLAISYEYTKDGVTTNQALSAGVYTVVAKITENENVANASSYPVTFTVKKADVVIGLTAKSENYTGAVIAIDAPTISGGTALSDLSFVTTYTGIEGTNYPIREQAPSQSGNYLVTVSTLGDDNHNQASGSVSLIIKQRSATITLSDASFVYDGSSKKLSGNINPFTLPISYTYSGVLADGTDYPATDVAPVNAGQYTVVAQFAGDNNYEPTSATAQMTIQKKASSIWMVSKSVEYTGNPVSIDKPVSDPANAELTITYTKTARTRRVANATEPIDVGTYSVKAEFAGNSNYLPSMATAEIAITLPGVPTLTMANKMIVYNGNQHAIDPATITTANAKHLAITYTYKNATYPASTIAPTNAGVYSVTATTATDVNYPVAGEITATLTINKADQVITFDSEQLEGKSANDKNFNLVASSDSKLEVSFMSGNTEIADIAGNTVSIKKAGVVTITAIQNGNENYNAAVSVVHTLNIAKDVEPKPEPKLDYLLINDQKVEADNGYFRYLVPQDYTSGTINLKAQLSQQGIVHGLPETIDVSKPSVQKIEFSITAADGTGIVNYILEIEKRFDFNVLVVTRWNNTLTVINNSSKHGFKFTAFQWYKDEAPIAGATLQSYTMGKNGEQLSDVSAYYVEVTDSQTGQILRCWPSTLNLNSLIVTAYPNPVKQSQLLTISADVDDALLKGAKIMIYNLSGHLVKTQAVTGKETQVEISAAGTYVIKLVGNNEPIHDFKVTVN